MPRVTVSLSDSILVKADEEAHKGGLSRSEYVAKAIESHVTGSNQANIELHNTQLELNKSQTEVMQLGRKIAKLDNQIAEKDKTIESKTKDVMQAEEKLNQAYADVMQARNETAKYEMAIKGKEDEISFLRGHVAQLTQSISQFALKPGEEEIKKKGWSWRFWRR
jgi:metal-responsive CopG/Arc/MetJ family transcriptional regulator